MADNPATQASSARAMWKRLGSPIRFRHLAGGTLGLTYVLMLLGAYTSAIGAGLSCPDWPACYGVWVPFLHPEIIAESPYSALQIFAEWFHRGLAMAVGFLILGTTLAAWRVRRDRPVIVWTATLALLLLPIQVILGGLTVTRLLQPLIVTAHLGTAVVILLTLTMATFAAWLYDHNSVPK